MNRIQYFISIITLLTTVLSGAAFDGDSEPSKPLQIYESIHNGMWAAKKKKKDEYKIIPYQCSDRCVQQSDERSLVQA